MSDRLRPICLGIAVIAIISAVVGFSRPTTMENAVADILEAAGPFKWHRGNLHTHSHWSDGDDYLENITLWYIEHGYDFLAFTDHNTLADKDRWQVVETTKGGQKAYDKLKAQFPDDWIEERDKDGKTEIRMKRFKEVAKRFNKRGKFLLIQGEEISDHVLRSPIHLNANNLVEAIPPMGGQNVTEAIQNNVSALIAQRERTRRPMMIHLNHPNFGWGITAEDLAPIRGENFFEVYNGHPSVNNTGDETHASTERIWDIINSLRISELDLPLLYGLACDDSHSYHTIPSRESEPGRGWVMVLSDRLDPSTLIHSMEAGRFYASSGVTLDKVVVTRSRLEVSVRPDSNANYMIEFIGTRKGFDRTAEPYLDSDGKKLPVTQKYSAEIGVVLQSHEGTMAAYTFTGNELYVRARITSSRPHPNPSMVGESECAWTQPVRP